MKAHTPLTVFSTESPGPESSLDLEDLLGFHLCLVASWDSSSWEEMFLEEVRPNKLMVKRAVTVFSQTGFGYCGRD